MENQWLQMNNKKIESIKYHLTELMYKHENPGVDLNQVQGLIIAAVNEIKRLQKEINGLNEELKKK